MGYVRHHLFASFGGQANDNVIEYNYIEDIDAQFSNVTEDGSRGLIIRRNIFIGYELSGGLQRPETQMIHNTFYKTAWNGSLHNFNLAKSSIHGNPVDSVIKNNAFIDTARVTDPNSGWYSIRDFDGLPTAGVTADYNFVSPMKAGFQEAHGINGGNPRFQDAANPLGPDGLPFTLDDGLKPLPGSPLCGKGEGGVDMGAYSCDPMKVFSDDRVPPRPPANLRIVR